MAPSLLERQLLRVRNGLTYYAGLRRVPLAQTPRDLVWQRDTARLWRYRSDQRRFVTPVVLVHSLVSRSYILDLLPNNSMISFLVEEGFDVFLLDWMPAGPADAENTLETYVDHYIPAALRATCAGSGAEDLTVVGYCFGGVLALLLAAGSTDLPIRNLITLTTPCDYTKMGFMSQMFVEGRLDAEDVIDANGIVPAKVIDLGFQSLRPTDALVQQVNVWENLWNDQWLTSFIAMNKWARDQIPFAGAAFRQTVNTLIRANALASGAVPFRDTEVRLSDITCPYLNVFCRRDEIVPPQSAEPLGTLVGSEDTTDLCLESGHVGLVAGRQAAKVSRPQIAEWIRDRSDDSSKSPASDRRGREHSSDKGGVR
ncbi:MAG TPA: alpha/beta fold hydrolase [Solirubrobacteraceae bacterium]|nr:alpha/beta fold hydrolase [Solirubrobacteraceae bacterium]